MNVFEIRKLKDVRKHALSGVYQYIRERPAARFPEDFMFQLSAEEKSEVVANCDHLSKLKYCKRYPMHLRNTVP
jgi:hypothetical protein